MRLRVTVRIKGDWEERWALVEACEAVFDALPEVMDDGEGNITATLLLSWEGSTNHFVDRFTAVEREVRTRIPGVSGLTSGWKDLDAERLEDEVKYG